MLGYLLQDQLSIAAHVFVINTLVLGSALFTNYTWHQCFFLSISSLCYSIHVDLWFMYSTDNNFAPLSFSVDWKTRKKKKTEKKSFEIKSKCNKWFVTRKVLTISRFIEAKGQVKILLQFQLVTYITKII